MESMPQLNVSRRHLLGLGAAAGAATVVGLAGHVPLAAAAPEDGGFGQTGRQLPNYTAVTPLAGLQATTIGYADFQALGTGSNNGTTFASPPSVYNENGTGVAASLRLPVGSVLRQVDVFGFRGPGAGTSLTFNLYKSSLGASTARTTLGSVTLTGSGEVQGVITLAPAVSVAIGDVVTLEADATSQQVRVAGAVYQYAPAGGIYVPIAPKRVYDSRQDTAGKLAVNLTRKVSVANEIAANGGATNVVPAGATGVAYNLTITQTEQSFGYLTVVAGDAATGGPSSINWDRADATLANGLQGPLNAAREVSVFCGGNANAKTHFLIDVLGYYL